MGWLQPTDSEQKNERELKTLLNQIEKHRSFVYDEVRWVKGAARLTLAVLVRPRAHSRAHCPGCGRRGPGYDPLAPRRFEPVPLWGIAVFLVHAMRRVNCAG